MSAPTATTEYTVGLLFWGDDLLLVRKTHPAWQAGLFNGIGGKTDPGETSANCMAREFLEETGIRVEAWEFLCGETGRDYRVDFYHHHLSVLDPRPVPPVGNDRGELLGWISRHEVGRMPIVGNLHWLIPMAMDWRKVRCRVVASRDIVEKRTWAA